MKEFTKKITFNWIVGSLCLLAFIPSCLTVNKALVKVLGSDSATNVILRLHPCSIAKDSVVRHSDTTVHIDTTYSDFILPRGNMETGTTTDISKGALNNSKFIGSNNSKPSKSNSNQSLPPTRTITNTKTIHDSAIHYQTTQRDIDIANSTLLISTKQIASLQQIVIDNDAEIKAKGGLILKLIIGSIFSFVCLCLSNAFWIWNKFK